MTTDAKPASRTAAAAPRYQGIQVARLIASTAVVVFHAGRQSMDRFGSFPVWQQGQAGVDLFFVISGFVILWSSVSLMQRSGGWRQFVERRVIRVIPMYWLATTCKIAAVLALPAMVEHVRLTWGTATLSYLFLPSKDRVGDLYPILGVGWTLNCEMFFYILFATAMLLRKNVFRVVGICFAILALGSNFRKHSWPAISFYLSTTLLEFYFGMLIAWFCIHKRKLQRPIALLLAVSGAVLLFAPFPHLKAPAFIERGIPSAMLILGFSSLEEYFEDTPASILFLADATYVTYLFHLLIAQAPAFLMAKHHLNHPWLAWALSIIVSLFAGSIIHAYIEEPITNTLRRAAGNRRAKWPERVENSSPPVPFEASLP